MKQPNSNQSRKIFSIASFAGFTGLLLSWFAYVVDGYQTSLAGVYSVCITLCAVAGASALIIFAGIAPLKKTPFGIGKIRFGLAALVVSFILSLLLDGSTTSSFSDPDFVNITVAYLGTMLAFMQVLSVGVVVAGLYEIFTGKSRSTS